MARGKPLGYMHLEPFSHNLSTGRVGVSRFAQYRHFTHCIPTIVFAVNYTENGKLKIKRFDVGLEGEFSARKEAAVRRIAFAFRAEKEQEWLDYQAKQKRTGKYGNRRFNL